MYAHALEPEPRKAPRQGWANWETEPRARIVKLAKDAGVRLDLTTMMVWVGWY